MARLSEERAWLAFGLNVALIAPDDTDGHILLFWCLCISLAKVWEGIKPCLDAWQRACCGCPDKHCQLCWWPQENRQSDNEYERQQAR